MHYIYIYFSIFTIAIILFFGIIIFRQKFFSLFLNKLKIREKIILSFTILFLILVTFIGLAIEWFNYIELQDDLNDRLSSLAVAKSHHIQTYFDLNIERLKSFNSRTALRKNLAQYKESALPENLEAVNNIIKDAMISVKDLNRISVIGVDGLVIASSDENVVGKNTEKENYFIQGQEKEGVFFVKEGDVYNIFIAGPMEYEGDFVGVGVLVTDFNYLRQIVQNRIGLRKTGEVLVAFYNEKGEITYPLPRLFESEAVEIIAEDVSTAEPMKQALLGKSIFFDNTLDYRNKPVFAISEYINIARLGLVVKIDRAEALDEIRGSVILFSVMSLLFVLLYFVFSSALAKFLTSPLEKLNIGVRNIGSGIFGFKVEEKGDDEITDLARAFNIMSEKVKKSRLEIEKKVEEQTEELKNKTLDMSLQQKATLNILEDVEDEKNKVEHLAGDLEKYKLAVENASDHVIITDVNGIVLYANKAVAKMTGYSTEEVLNKKVGSLWSEKAEKNIYDEIWKNVRENKKYIITQITNIRKGGEKYEASISVAPILDDAKKVKYFVSIERDITKEKEVDRAKTEFVSLASHQLRTPLSTINWYTEMLLNGDAGKLATEQNEYMQEIYKSNQRMVELVNALLNVSRLDLGTFIVEPKMLDIYKISDDAIDELKHKITEKKIKFSKKYDKSVDKMSLDEKLTMIIFQNLLSNAVKYTPDGGKVILDIAKKDKDLQIKVSDTGLGIPLSQQEKIFQKMFRADNVRATDTEGTGLGLYIVKQILEHAGGKIWFKSVQNKGTDFYVTIPLLGMKKKEGTRKLED